MGSGHPGAGVSSRMLLGPAILTAHLTPHERVWRGHQAPWSAALLSLLCRQAGSAGQSRAPPPTPHTDLRTCYELCAPPPPRPTSTLFGGAPLPGFFLPCPRGRV